MAEERLSAGFFEREVAEVARDLLGCMLVHDGVGGTIVETEAYHESEPACHAYGARTARNSRLFGPPGHAYVYLSYGVHSLFNVVSGPQGEGAAVLVRALEPTTGIDTIRGRRAGRADPELCSGPGKLTEALAITLDHDGVDLAEGALALLPRPVAGPPPPVEVDVRVGITKAAELPWRFCVAGSPYVSRPQPRALAA